MRKKLNTNIGELLLPVSPELQLKDLIIGNYYLLPSDKIKEVKRMLLSVNKKTGICELKSHIIKPDMCQYDIYRVHYSWIRDLKHVPILNLK
jgi:hypothetical protein